ncbi:uncharacterized protein LOC110644705 [Hevea brasiliensis]|uniref:uncharacterized protein LOC110644705 n=1 Tax=Hevea brasiliensis TaxID=3981 RepID=UPI0025EF123E|nr:uncharacterized protein LOC110644705 [Hevea brasiliensis]
MAELEQSTKPVLQRPPGYRDPSNPVPRPPLRKGVLPPSFQPRGNRKICSSRLCCCILCITFATILFFLGLLLAFVYLWFDPKLPVFHVQSFKIPIFNVSAKPNGIYLNAATVARVEVKNPNSRLAHRYSVYQVDVTLGNDQGTELGSTTLPGFTHAKRNTTSLKIETQLKNQLIDDATGSRLKTRYKSRNLVVNVRVKTSVGLGVVKGFKIGMLAVAVLCDGITLKEDDGGHMPRCTIRTLKWLVVKKKNGDTIVPIFIKKKK